MIVLMESRSRESAQLNFLEALDGNPGSGDDGNRRDEFESYLAARLEGQRQNEERIRRVARQKRGTPASRADRDGGGPSADVCNMGESGTHDLTRPYRCSPGLVDQVDDAKAVDVRVEFEERDGDVADAEPFVAHLGGLGREADVEGHLRRHLATGHVDADTDDRSHRAGEKRPTVEVASDSNHDGSRAGIDAKLEEVHRHLRAPPREYPATFSADEIHGLLACQKILRAMRAVCVQARREGVGIGYAFDRVQVIGPRLLVDADAE